MSGNVPFQGVQAVNRHHFIVSVAWSDDGELLATGGSDPQTIIWNKDGTQRQVLPTGGWVSSLGFEPKSHRLAVGMQNGEIHLWDLETKSSKKLASPNKAWVTFRWSSDGKQIASAGYDGTLSLWDVKSGKAKHTILKDSAGNGLSVVNKCSH
jgi:WD40 repeat protein